MSGRELDGRVSPCLVAKKGKGGKLPRRAEHRANQDATLRAVHNRKDRVTALSESLVERVLQFQNTP